MQELILPRFFSPRERWLCCSPQKVDGFATPKALSPGCWVGRSCLCGCEPWLPRKGIRWLHATKLNLGYGSDTDDVRVERDDGAMVVMGDDDDAAGGGGVVGGGGDGGGCGTNSSVPFGSVICPPRNPLMQKARGQGLLRIPWFTATPTRTTMTTTATARSETRKNKKVQNHNKKTTTTHNL